MSPQPQQGMLPSVLDRLLDPESAGTSVMTGYTVEKMAAAVRRDLEELLNTVCPYMKFPDGYPETRDSVVTYGLPDLTSVSATQSDERTVIGGLIRRAVEKFEPRLKQVRVTVLDREPDAVRSSLKFRVDARLTVDPAPEVAFDTILDVGTGKYEVNRVNG